MGTVIVGASVAGVNVAASLRSKGYEGSITLVDQDPRLPYDKPPLSKHALKPDWEPARGLLKPANFYADNGIELVLGQPAVALVPRASGGTVRLADGTELGGERVVLAPGVRARTLGPGGTLRGVHTIRTAEDSERLGAVLAPGRRIVVVGCGFIGAEAAGIARELGCEVTIVERATVPFAHLFGDDIGRALAARHAERGVRLRTGVGVRALRGEEAVSAVELEDGTIVPADAVLLGLGAEPATQWLTGSGLDLRAGIRCDARGRTALPGVYAAGDAAAWYDPESGAWRRIEHWTTAREQAAVVAATIVDPDLSPPVVPSVPYFWSDQYGARLQFLGTADGADDVRLVSGSLEGDQFVALYGREGRLVGALGLDAVRELMRYRGLIAAKAPIASARDQAMATPQAAR